MVHPEQRDWLELELLRLELRLLVELLELVNGEPWSNPLGHIVTKIPFDSTAVCPKHGVDTEDEELEPADEFAELELEDDEQTSFVI